ncbi:MAG: hypothetical protein HY297_05235 [Thaumarchaeota archaeon]|nr:hypothetical protein [Nitrososphaerota archaeon]
MKPVLGISLELLALACALALSLVVPLGAVRYLYIIAAQFLATYLIHCPAHYVVGRALGIRFRSIRLGRTTLVKALPDRFKSLGRLFPILTLSTERSSLARASRLRAGAMFSSGTVASSGSAVVIAAAVSPYGDVVATLLASAFAAGYLTFDIVFSPRLGDLMRARTFSPDLVSG